MKKSLFSNLFPILVISATLLASDWPQWRGPEGLGISSETGLTLEWRPDKNIRWKAALPGQGHSSPVASGERIFVTSAVKGAQLESGPSAIKHIMNGEEFKHPQWAGSDHSWTLKLLCLNRADGQILWERDAFQGKVYDHIHEQGSYAASTPATDGEHVWAYFGAEGLYCYDYQGNLVWKASLGGIGTIGMGTGTSPVLFEDTIILVADQEFDGSESFMIALDKSSGKEVWRVKRQARAGWATPLLVEANGRTEMVVSAAEQVISYDPKDGRELWRSPGVISNAIPSPVSDGEIVYVSAGSQTKRTYAVRLGGAGELAEDGDQVLWRYDKGAAYVPSPIYYAGHLYLLTDNGLVTCLDGPSGEVVYQERLPGQAAYKASPVAVDGRLLITTQDGLTHVVKAGPEFQVLASNDIGEALWASPAISDGTIYLRGGTHLFAIGK